jgi:general secretion pathway protein G
MTQPKRKVITVGVVCLAVLLAVLIPAYGHFMRKNREAILQTNLLSLRQVIRQYTADKNEAPQSLQDLVDAGYYRQELPWDPLTDRHDTWIPQYDSISKSRITDVHSGAMGVSTAGTPYNAW